MCPREGVSWEIVGDSSNGKSVIYFYLPLPDALKSSQLKFENEDCIIQKRVSK